MTSNNLSLCKIINVKVVVCEAAVSNYDNLKVFVISMTKKKSLLGLSEKIHRVTDSTPQYGSMLQFNNSPHFMQQTLAWHSD